MSQGKEATPGSSGSQKRTKELKLPMPPDEELEQRFNAVLFKRRVQESTQILRELEISLRTNHIGWAQEFLNEENQGLDVLVDYLSFAHSAVTYVSAQNIIFKFLEHSWKS
ncbi:Formin-like protein 2 [Collichthys lucidus]|uniref:Formin-like protein 2 n=1 Tax=Collichthys lucidus TaxID=240159 RepID=A0A4U5VM83_COLLU|nr:Formin-like protein 2 [Collichthys lucidus]